MSPTFAGGPLQGPLVVPAPLCENHGSVFRAKAFCVAVHCTVCDKYLDKPEGLELSHVNPSLRYFKVNKPAAPKAHRASWKHFYPDPEKRWELWELCEH